MWVTIGYAQGWLGGPQWLLLRTYGPRDMCEAKSTSSAHVLMAGNLLYKGCDHVMTWSSVVVWASVTSRGLA